MKKRITILKAIVPFVVLMTVTIIGLAQTAITLPANLRKNIVNNRLPSHIQLSDAQLKKIMIKKIDLAASSITFTTTCKDRYHGTVKVEGVIRNVGGLAYTTGPNQQSALLYEDNGGRLNLVASQSFQNLAPNAEVKVSYTRPWYTASPAEGEFPPRYVLIVTFDPDIYIDANDNNDDSNNSNNRFTKSAAEVNTNWRCK